MTTFTELTSKGVEKEAIGMIPTHDQLKLAMSQGFYPNYKEMDINFLPSYKMSSTKQGEYVNKRDQAPSYTDRVMYKNNTSLTI